MVHSIKRVTVITGDPRLPDSTKRNAQYNEEDVITHEAMKSAFRRIPEFEFDFVDDHSTLLDRFREDRPDLVVNFCDTGFRNRATQELNLPAYLELLDIPYTGAPPAAMVICYDKAIVRLVA
jgi:D-alanine-D-alanine ligase